MARAFRELVQRSCAQVACRDSLPTSSILHQHFMLVTEGTSREASKAITICTSRNALCCSLKSNSISTVRQIPREGLEQGYPISTAECGSVTSFRASSLLISAMCTPAHSAKPQRSAARPGSQPAYISSCSGFGCGIDCTSNCFKVDSGYVVAHKDP